MDKDKVKVKESLQPKPIPAESGKGAAADDEQKAKKQVTMSPAAAESGKGAAASVEQKPKISLQQAAKMEKEIEAAHHDEVNKGDHTEHLESEHEDHEGEGEHEELNKGEPKDHHDEAGHKDHRDTVHKDHHDTDHKDHHDDDHYDHKQSRAHADGDDIESKINALFQDGATRNAQQPRLVRPKLVFANTYQLGPIVPFNVSKVEKIIKNTLNEVLDGMTYNSKRAANLTGTLAEMIRDKVLEQEFDRYKIVVLVSIGPKGGQGVDIGTQCLWDSTRDKVAYGEFINQYIFASACVYGIYYD